MNYLWTSAAVGNSMGMDFCIIQVPQNLTEELIKTMDCNKDQRLQRPFKKTEGFWSTQNIHCPLSLRHPSLPSCSTHTLTHSTSQHPHPLHTPYPLL